jgi:excisionase family DNA binding protein
MTGDGSYEECRGVAKPSGRGGASQPPELVTHLAVALSRHVRDLRQAGAFIPAEVEELATFLAQAVRSRPQATPVADVTEAEHSSPVVERLLVTKGEAAERLGVSVRTIERLVSAGRLTLVHVERAARLRVSDLKAYVHGLAEGDTPPPGDDEVGSAPDIDRPPQGPVWSADENGS